MIGSARLADVLGRAQKVGLVGPGEVGDHIGHARCFAGAVGGPVDGLCVDLGSGGGLPGLVLALEWGESRWCLVDRRRRSVEFLQESASILGVGERVQVTESPAEELGRTVGMRRCASLVVARGFGPAAVVAECAAPLLVPGGRLVVSEAPGSSGERWVEDKLAVLGMGRAEVKRVGGAGFALITQVEACPESYPRRNPAKRPLW